MKVTKITESKYKDAKGNLVSSWWLALDGDKRQLKADKETAFVVGTDVSIESLEVKKFKSGKNMGEEYFVISDKPKESAKVEVGAPTHIEKPSQYKGRDEAATDARTVLMQSWDAYKFTHQLKPTTVIDWVEFDAIANELQKRLAALRVGAILITREKK